MPLEGTRSVEGSIVRTLDSRRLNLSQTPLQGCESTYCQRPRLQTINPSLLRAGVGITQNGLPRSGPVRCVYTYQLNY